MEVKVINHNLESIKKQIELVFKNHEQLMYKQVHTKKEPLRELV